VNPYYSLYDGSVGEGEIPGHVENIIMGECCNEVLIAVLVQSMALILSTCCETREKHMSGEADCVSRVSSGHINRKVVQHTVQMILCAWL
jgi:hypothetical protein